MPFSYFLSKISVVLIKRRRKAKLKKKSNGEQSDLCNLEQVTLKPELQVSHYLTTWLQIWYHGLLWRGSFREGADLEEQIWNSGNNVNSFLFKVSSIVTVRSSLSSTVQHFITPRVDPPWIS